MARERYEWAIPHIEAGLGAIRLDHLDHEDVARWLDDIAIAGQLSWPSIQICLTVLRAALTDAVDGRTPSTQPGRPRVPMPRDTHVTRPAPHGADPHGAKRPRRG
jgi:hypothetical protein